MPWTDAARRQYARPAARYATELTDAEYALLAPHLPAPERLGRPREVDLREVLNAILYLLRAGCPWRLLPKEFPPKSTVFGYFQRFWADGTWLAIDATLVMAARERAGPGRRRRRPASSTARASRPPRPAGRVATTRARKFSGASGMSWSTRWACSWAWSSRPRRRCPRPRRAGAGLPPAPAALPLARRAVRRRRLPR